MVCSLQPNIQQWSQTSGVVFMGCKFIRSAQNRSDRRSLRPTAAVCVFVSAPSVFAPRSLCLVLFLECLEYFFYLIDVHEIARWLGSGSLDFHRRLVENTMVMSDSELACQVSTHIDTI